MKSSLSFFTIKRIIFAVRILGFYMLDEKWRNYLFYREKRERFRDFTPRKSIELMIYYLYSKI